MSDKIEMKDHIAEIAALKKIINDKDFQLKQAYEKIEGWRYSYETFIKSTIARGDKTDELMKENEDLRKKLSEISSVKDKPEVISKDLMVKLYYDQIIKEMKDKIDKITKEKDELKEENKKSVDKFRKLLFSCLEENNCNEEVTDCKKCLFIDHNTKKIALAVNISDGNTEIIELTEFIFNILKKSFKNIQIVEGFVPNFTSYPIFHKDFDNEDFLYIGFNEYYISIPFEDLI